MHNIVAYGHSQEDVVIKQLMKWKRFFFWLNQLQIALMVLFNTFYGSRYKNIDVVVVRWLCKFSQYKI